jgi:hypothetical protein
VWSAFKSNCFPSVTSLTIESFGENFYLLPLVFR